MARAVRNDHSKVNRPFRCREQLGFLQSHHLSMDSDAIAVWTVWRNDIVGSHPPRTVTFETRSTTAKNVIGFPIVARGNEVRFPIEYGRANLASAAGGEAGGALDDVEEVRVSQVSLLNWHRSSTL